MIKDKYIEQQKLSKISVNSIIKYDHIKTDINYF